MASQSEIVVRFAGEGGQGVVTAAEILARAVSSVGFHSLTFATFPSQILGGPTWTQARLSRTPVLSPGDTIDILVAFNSQAYDEHRPEVREGGVILLDPSVTPDPADVAHRCITVPFDDLAKQTGEARAANMVVMGGLSHLINVGLDLFKEFVSRRFAGRAGVVEANHVALDLGFAHLAEEEPIADLGDPEPPDYDQLFIKGNEALAIGAMHAGIDFYIGYPISPATPILVFMERNLIGPGKVAIQASSEIESITGVLGAGFAGKKAMTATSGPGFTLMGEGIGLAWMAEIPGVVIDVQRGGPATGLPTKTEQSDLLAALAPAHGDSRIPIIAPGTVEECFYAAVHAFNWAERYQGPVLILSEHSLAERAQNVPKPDLSKVPVTGRVTYTGDNGYLRYDAAELSPMPIPRGPGSYVANGSEHDSYGDTTHWPVAPCPHDRAPLQQAQAARRRPLRGRADVSQDCGLPVGRVQGARARGVRPAARRGCRPQLVLHDVREPNAPGARRRVTAQGPGDRAGAQLPGSDGDGASQYERERRGDNAVHGPPVQRQTIEASALRNESQGPANGPRR